jgi:hypothetical protein
MPTSCFCLYPWFWLPFICPLAKLTSSLAGHFPSSSLQFIPIHAVLCTSAHLSIYVVYTIEIFCHLFSFPYVFHICSRPLHSTAMYYLCLLLLSSSLTILHTILHSVLHFWTTLQNGGRKLFQKQSTYNMQGNKFSSQKAKCFLMFLLLYSS